jgi:hypothetical protein
MAPGIFGDISKSSNKTLFPIFTHYMVCSQKIILILLGTIK